MYQMFVGFFFLKWPKINKRSQRKLRALLHESMIPPAVLNTWKKLPKNTSTIKRSEDFLHVSHFFQKVLLYWLHVLTSSKSPQKTVWITWLQRNILDSVFIFWVYEMTFNGVHCSRTWTLSNHLIFLRQH